MSLLDDVSIVVTPNGYKAGELYAVVPVPTEGAELVTNGDFELNSDWSNFGTPTTSEQSTEQSHTGTYSWKVIADATQEGIFSPNNFSITNGNSYSVSLWIYSVSGDSIKSGLNNTNVSVFTERTVIAGQWTNITYEATATSTGASYISILSQNSLNFYVDNVSVKEYTSADMDVTRATAATRVDENGLVNYAEVLGGEEVTCGDFECASPLTYWNTGTGITIGSGVALFTSVSSGLQLNQVSLGGVVGKTYKISYEIKTRTEGAFSASIGGALSSNQNSEVGVYTEYLTATGAGTFYIRSRGTTSGSIDNVSVKEVTRDNVPRIDYTGGGCPHILAEPQRTNLVTESSDFTTWTTTGSAEVTPNTTISPDGTQNADTLNIFSGNFFYKPITSGAGTFTLSCYVKVASGTLDFKMQSFNGTDGADASSTFTANTNWQRFEFTTTVTTDSNFYPIQVSGLTGGDFQIWGAQVEESYATSYIPTSGSTVTRNQDIFTRDGIGSLINSEEGTIFVEMQALANDSTNRYISINDGSSTNRIIFKFGTSSNNISALGLGTATSFNMSYSSATITNMNKIALKYKVNDCALWVNGAEVATDTTFTAYTANTLNQINFSNNAGSGQFLDAKVKQLQVYNTALTDEQLLQLTGTSGTDFYESYAEMASALTYTIQ